MKRKAEMINTILNSLRTYELEMIVPQEEKDTIQTIAIKTQLIFNSFNKKQLTPLYKSAKFKLKYMNVGLIS